MDANPDGSDLVSSDFRKRIWMSILMAVILEVLIIGRGYGCQS